MFEGLFQPMHLLVILVIALVVFGPRRLPELGAGLGKGIREFKKAMSETSGEFSKSLSDGDKTEAAAPKAVDSTKTP
jgi:sec-independent protein translocase protein TatA